MTLFRFGPEAGRRGLSTAVLLTVAALRIVIGWHFLYEGLTKLLKPGWSAEDYLSKSQWLLADFFHWIAESPDVLWWVNLLNVWGLILIGAGLMLGVFTRVAALAGVVLLLLYYAAHPPLIGLSTGVPTEGSYLVIDKNVVEMFALLLLAIVPRSSFAGAGPYLAAAFRKVVRKIRRAGPADQAPLHRDPEGFGRRQLLATLAVVPVLGGFVYAVLRRRAQQSPEEKVLAWGTSPDGISGPSQIIAKRLSLDELKAKVPTAKIGDLDVSRVILGGNLINGFAHARDLIYVSPLVKAYHTVEKVLETVWIAEQCGMNTLIINTHAGGHFIEEYHRRNVGGTRFIAQCRAQDLRPRIQQAVDLGAKGAYIQFLEHLTQQNKFDEIAEALDFMRANGLVAGIGSHEIVPIRQCVQQGIEVDFCMKTFHHDNYWSAQPGGEFCDNRYCDDHDETLEFMKTFQRPWIAFKVLAAGAVHPKDGFRYAFENGADFICVGMYDFQVVEDANIAYNVLHAALDRDRPWRALA